MNFLAHLRLSSDDPEEMAGNLLADYIKGRQIEALPPVVRRGVLHHRAIDAYTDAHPAVRRSVARFPRPWRRFAPVILDVSFDHYLAADWQRWNQEPLRQWLRPRYACLQRVAGEDLPEPLCPVIHRIVETDRLGSYADPAGRRAALERLSRRLERWGIYLPDALEVMADFEDDLRADFAVFFPDLLEFSSQRLQEQVS